MLNFVNILNSDSEGYIDLSGAKVFHNENTSGCITLIFTSNGIRTKLCKSLLADIDEPEQIQVLFTEKNVIFCKANEDSSFTVKSDGIIYGTALAKKIAELANIEVQKNGSKKAGTYHLQKLDDDTKAAVVSFKEGE